MQLSKRKLNRVRILGTVTLCVFLIAFLFTGQVKQTFSYVQTMSGTCVNIFIGEVTETPVDPPDQPDNPDNPDIEDEPSDTPVNNGEVTDSADKHVKTGDDFNMFSWVFIMQLSLLAFLIIFDCRAKEMLIKR